MSRPRLLLPIIVQFEVRTLLRTGLIQQIAEYAQPVVLQEWEDPELQRDFEQAGAEVHRLPEVHLGRDYRRVLRHIDVWHLQRLRSPSTTIDKRRRNAMLPWHRRMRLHAREAFYRSRLRMPGAVQRLFEAEKRLVETDTNINDLRRMFEELRPDALLTSWPFFRQELLLARLASLMQLPLCAPIASFDNITTRGWIPATFDTYFLWNQYNVRELHRAYPETHDVPVTIVGAPQFDFYWDDSYVWDEKTWRKTLNLPADCPVILFGAGHYQIVPHEPHWLQQLDEAVERGEIPGQPIILFRRHPNDPLDRWQSVLNQARHVVYDNPWPEGKTVAARTNVRRTDIERLASTLKHTAVHINASSTMTIDGAIFDRPQIGPAYDDRSGRRYDRIVKDLYEREHFLPITYSGGLDVVCSREEMVAAVRTAFEHPEQRAEGRKRLVREICAFTDGKSTERLNRALETFLVRQ